MRPKKNRSGNRAYRSKEIKIIRYIKYLLYEEMYTIPGAKKKMADANMADMEGQLTLLRVPATAPLPSRAVETADSTETVPGNGHAANGTLIPAAFQATAEDVRVATAERSDSDSDASSHALDGGEAAARLREELKRVKQELQSLLAALAVAGRTAP